MIYVNVSTLRPGQTAFDSTITHEFQHMAQFAHCPNQEGWVDEGASELAMRVAGYDGGLPATFAAHPDIQLTSWSQGSDVLRHYQAAYLFIRYVAERAGGWDALPTLFASCARGESLFTAFLAQRPIAPDLDGLVADWMVANLLQDASVADGRYAYANGGFHAADTGTAAHDVPFLGAVPPYAANYVDLPAGGGIVTFSADTSVAWTPASRANWTCAALPTRPCTFRPGTTSRISSTTSISALRATAGGRGRSCPGYTPRPTRPPATITGLAGQARAVQAGSTKKST